MYEQHVRCEHCVHWFQFLGGFGENDGDFGYCCRYPPTARRHLGYDESMREARAVWPIVGISHACGEFTKQPDFNLICTPKLPDTKPPLDNAQSEV